MGKQLYKGSFFKNFMVINDRREEGKVRHKLIDILFIAVAASICYCNEWQDMEDWAIEHEEWLRRYLELPNGVPSWYTIERVFDVINPKQFILCFVEWVKKITNVTNDTVVAIDGKTMCGTGNEDTGKRAVHIVSAWCSENGLVLGQVKTNDKSNEITAIPELLDMLLIKGAIVTTDAMGTQKEIARKIVKDNKADYVLALKENHPLLHEEVESYFKDAEKDGFRSNQIGKHRTVDKGHGRIEERQYYYSTDIGWMDARKEWQKLTGVGMVIRRCEKRGKVTEERAYHLGSVTTVEDYARGARKHWGVESMHWNLDVTFREDANRTRTGAAPQNLALLKRLAMNMVKKDQERYPKRSLRSRRFLASLKESYLDYIFAINFK